MISFKVKKLNCHVRKCASSALAHLFRLQSIQIKEDWTGMCYFIAKHVTFMSINEFVWWCLTPLSAVSWQSVLRVEETGGPGENYRPVTSHWQTLSHNVVHHALIEIRTTGTCFIQKMYAPSSIFFAYLWFFRWPNYIVTLPRYFSLRLEGTGVPGKNHRPVASHWQTLSHIVVLSTPRRERVRTHTFSGNRRWLHR